MLESVGWDNVWRKRLRDGYGEPYGELCVEYVAIETDDEPELRLRRAWLHLGLDHVDGPVLVPLGRSESHRLFMRHLGELFDLALAAKE